jgi:hypothetical protein
MGVIYVFLATASLSGHKQKMTTIPISTKVKISIPLSQLSNRAFLLRFPRRRIRPYFSFFSAASAFYLSYITEEMGGPAIEQKLVLLFFLP